MKKIVVLLSAILLGADLLLKQIISENFNASDRLVIIDGFFEMRYVKNFGAAWGMLSGKQSLFLIITPIILIGLIYYFTKVEDGISITGIALIFFGAIGNYYDRIVLGFVRDMFSFDIFGYAFPVFNIADSMVVVGVGLLILATILEEMRYRNV